MLNLIYKYFENNSDLKKSGVRITTELQSVSGPTVRTRHVPFQTRTSGGKSFLFGLNNVRPHFCPRFVDVPSWTEFQISNNKSGRSCHRLAIDCLSTGNASASMFSGNSH